MLSLLIMAVVQGLTEFLPVSSSGHLLFIQSLYKIKDINLSLDILLHLATFLVIIIYFFKDIRIMVKGVIATPLDLKAPSVKLFYMILLSCIPTALIGLAVKKNFSFLFEQGSVLYITWPATALLLIFSDRIRSNKITLEKITPLHALLIGTAQGLAVLPGISRSGITIITALFLGLGRRDSFKYSFLVGIPVMAGAFILELPDIGKLNFLFSDMIIIFLFAFAAGMAGLLVLKRFLDQRKFKFFGYYLILALTLFLVLNRL